MVYFSASPSDSVRHSSFHQVVNGNVLYYMFTLYLIAFRADTKSMRSKVLKAATHMRTGTSGSHASEHRSVAVGREGIVLRIPILIPEYLLQVEKCPIFHFFFLWRNHSFDPMFFFFLRTWKTFSGHHLWTISSTTFLKHSIAYRAFSLTWPAAVISLPQNEAFIT